MIVNGGLNHWIVLHTMSLVLTTMLMLMLMLMLLRMQTLTHTTMQQPPNVDHGESKDTPNELDMDSNAMIESGMLHLIGNSNTFMVMMTTITTMTTSTASQIWASCEPHRHHPRIHSKIIRIQTFCKYATIPVSFSRRRLLLLHVSVCRYLLLVL